MLMPAAVAADLPETTTPWLPAATLGSLGVTGVLLACGQVPDASRRSKMADIRMTLFIGDELRHSGRHQCPAYDARLYQFIYSALPPGANDPIADDQNRDESLAQHMNGIDGSREDQSSPWQSCRRLQAEAGHDTLPCLGPA